MRPLILVHALGRNALGRISATLFLVVLTATALAPVCMATLPPVCLTEVYTMPTGTILGHQKVELCNVSLLPVDISGWRFWVDSNYREIPPGTILMPDESFVIHIAADGVNDPHNLYTGTFFPGLNGDTGSVALFAPGSNFTKASDLLDYVQWGPGPNLPGSGLANEAGIWTVDMGSITPALTPGVSMQWCSSFLSGPAAWGQDPENIGAFNPCALTPMPTEEISWGKVKSLFRD